MGPGKHPVLARQHGGSLGLPRKSCRSGNSRCSGPTARTESSPTAPRSAELAGCLSVKRESAEETGAEGKQYRKSKPLSQHTLPSQAF